METDEDFKSTGNHAMLEESISKITSIASQISIFGAKGLAILDLKPALKCLQC